jgi:hypothetical protein
MQGEILSYIDVLPRQLTMRGDGTKKLTGEVNINSHLDKPLELTPESFTLDDKLSYTFEEVEKGKTFKFTFATKDVPETGYRGTMKVKTNSPEKPELRLNITVYIRKPPRIQLSRRIVRLRGRVGQELSGEVIIESTVNEPLTLTPEKRTFPETLSYVVEEVQKGKKFKVRFTAQPATKPETYQGSLTLGTNYDEQKNIRIHVVVQAR